MPEITVYFWVIKVLCTTAGETAADLLNEKAGLGLAGVSLLMSALLTVVLVVQFRTRGCRPGVYWLVVVLFWYLTERILSIHHIDTIRREALYWLAVLFTFALGTSVGDLAAEEIDLGYWVSAGLFAAALAAIALARFSLELNAVWSFWIAYILTRPLGASVGDYLCQPTGDGGVSQRGGRHAGRGGCHALPPSRLERRRAANLVARLASLTGWSRAGGARAPATRR